MLERFGFKEKREKPEIKTYEMTFTKEERYLLEILKKVGEELNVKVREIELIRAGEGKEIEESYEARKKEGEWSVEIIPPPGSPDLSEFWRRVEEEEKKYLEEKEKEDQNK
jgi:hypothetical protein